MKRERLFSGKNKKNIMSPAEFAQSVVKVKPSIWTPYHLIIFVLKFEHAHFHHENLPI